MTNPDVIDEPVVSDIGAHSSLEQAYDLQKAIDTATQAFDHLSERQKLTFAGHINDDSTEDMAAKLGLSQRTVQRDLERIVEWISKALKRRRGGRDDE